MNPIESILAEGMVPGLLVAGGLLALLPWIDRRSRLRNLPIAIVLALTAYYLHWRFTSTLPPVSNPVDFAFGCVFLAIESAAVLGSAISYISLTRYRDRTPEVEANLPWLAARKTPPLVDVFICTYNEEREILERTMLGATGMDYPNYRVWVLDDGRRPWLRELAEALDCNYLTRPDNAHAKAGNINHALRHVATLDERPDFISVLDADFVPARQFLARALSLFRAPDVGIVQTPQHFINPDPIQANLQAADVWPDEQRYFFDVLMPAKDGWGTAFCCGTSSVIRMAALAKAGGFPTDSVTEDYLLTIRLKRNGYRTVYLNERLSLGLAPEGLQEYITQRSRWCLGFIQIIRGEDGPFRFGNNLFLADRISLIESFLYWSAGYLFRVAGIAIPILYLLFGIQAVDVGVVDGLTHFVPYYVAQIAIMAWISGGRVLPVMTDVSQLLAAREILGSVFVGLVRPKGQKFKVTAKGGDRSHTIVQWAMIARFGTLLALTIAGVVFAFRGPGPLQESSVVALYWSWYNIIILTAAIAVCVERPRLRRNERLRGRERVFVSTATSRRAYETEDISVGGLRLRGAVDAAIGSPVSVEIAGGTLNGTLIRRTETDFAIALDDTQTARTAMVRTVYSGAYQAQVKEIRTGRVARKVARRLIG